MIEEESFDIHNTFTFSQDEVHKTQPLIQKFDQYFAPQKILYTKDTFFILAHKMDAYLTIF